MKIRNDQRLIDQFLTNHQNAAIAEIEAMENDEIALLLEHLDPDQVTVILSGMAPYKVGKVLERMSVPQATNVVGTLPTNISEPTLRVLPPSLRQQILVELPANISKPLKRSFTFSRTQVGAHLEPAFFTLSESNSIEKTLSEIKTAQATVQPHMFVVNNKRALVGYLYATDLLTNSPEKTIRSIMKPVSSTVTATMLVKDVLENWDNSMIKLPVVNAENQVVGIISRSTLSKLMLTSVSTDRLEVKAGSALGDLYLIGLSSLLGGSDQPANS